MKMDKLTGTHRSLIGSVLIVAGLVFGFSTQASVVEQSEMINLNGNIILSGEIIDTGR